MRTFIGLLLNVPTFLFTCFVLGAETESYSLVSQQLVYAESFERVNLNRWRNIDYQIIEDDINYISPGNGEAHLRVGYQPTEKGSKHYLQNFTLTKAVKRARLTFDVQFEESFEFVRGGKLHGLGGGMRTVGCTPIQKNGWSVRIMWLQNGKPIIYIYHQDRENRCGDEYAGENDFVFVPGKWHAIELEVKLNTDSTTNDGWATLYIDNIQIVKVENIKITGSEKAHIDTFMFNTFFGGGDETWKPSKKVYANFDNFKVISVNQLN